MACATPMPPVAHCRTGRPRGEQGRDAEATPRRARHTTLFPLPLVDVTQALPSSLACPPSATRRHTLPSVVALWRKQRRQRCDATLCPTHHLSPLPLLEVTRAPQSTLPLACTLATPRPERARDATPARVSEQHRRTLSPLATAPLRTRTEAPPMPHSPTPQPHSCTASTTSPSSPIKGHPSLAISPHSLTAITPLHSPQCIARRADSQPRKRCCPCPCSARRRSRRWATVTAEPCHSLPLFSLHPIRISIEP